MSEVMRKLRCAIYTRKSTEEGLDQNYNSLDAQRDACRTSLAELFIPLAVSENRVRSEYIDSFEEKLLGLYKIG